MRFFAAVEPLSGRVFYGLPSTLSFHRFAHNLHHGARGLFPPPLPRQGSLACGVPLRGLSAARRADPPGFLPTPFPVLYALTGSTHPLLSAPSLVHSLATIPQPRLDSLLLLRFPMLCFCLSFFLFCFSLRFALRFSLFARLRRFTCDSRIFLARFCFHSPPGIFEFTIR